MQAGIVYLKMCEESQQAPHRDILPVIHLALHGAAVANGTAGVAGAAAHAGRPAPDSRDSGGAVALQPAAPLKTPPEDLYIMVMCNNVMGRLHPASCRVEANGKEMSATQFEQFAGCASAKKWRASLKVVPGSCPECPEGATQICDGVMLSVICERPSHKHGWLALVSGAPPMQVGRWFDMMGLATGAARSKARKT